MRGPDLSYWMPKAVHDFSFNVSRPLRVSQETAKFQSLWAYVDPAAGGANADETAYAIGGFLNGNVYLLSAGGLPGGYDLPTLEKLADVLTEYPTDGVMIEKNMGHGAFAAVFSPVLRKAMAKKWGRECQIKEELVTGQKEMRIINILAPVMGRGALIVTDNVFEEDAATTARYAPALRLTYSLFYQMAHLSAARNALVHDDRLDALAGLVNVFKEAIAKDQSKEVERLQAAALAELRKDPLGYGRYGSPTDHRASLLARRGASSGILRRRNAR